MPAATRLNYLYLACLSRPKAERKLYRLIKRRRAARIVEIGITSLRRTLRMIHVAAHPAGPKAVWYTGIDAYDARPPATPPLALKETYRQLLGTGARIRLVPGDPLSALARTANVLADTDLLIIAAGHDAAALEAAWFYVPRMLHQGSLVLREQAGARGQGVFRAVAMREIQQLAGTHPRRCAA